MSLPLPALVAELRRRERREGFTADRLCFPPQRAFVRDVSRFRVAVCSRRAGKSVACEVLLLERALLKAKSNHVYITLSRVNAKRIVWRQLLDLNAAHDLGGVTNETDLSLRFPNGSVIYLSGAKDSAEVEKFRGLSLDTVVIDESQSFRAYLRQLIDDVLVPCLWDTQGILVLIGTPGPVQAGTFWEAWQAKAWSRHHWTVLDNPHIERLTGKSPAEILREERERRGITETDPTYRRESLGEWVQDVDALVFRYDPARNDFAALPTGRWWYVLGIDLGLDDADALAVLGWREEGPELYLVEEHVQAGQSITDLMEHVERLRTKYSPRRIVADFGGLGKKIGEEVRRRWGVPVEPAEKQRKLEHIALLNDALRSGRFLAPRGSRFAEDSALVQWEPEARGVRIADGFHSDICDAVLYAYRAAGHYLHEPAPPETTDPGELWERREVDRLRDAAGKTWAERDAEEMGFR